MGRHAHVDDFTPKALAWLAQAEAEPPAGLTSAQEDAAAAAFDDLTQTLLSRRPANAWEAVVMIEVVKAEADNGGRSDGLDVQALARVQDWLADELRCDPLPTRSPRPEALANPGKATA